jgi:hypothetical protein
VLREGVVAMQRTETVLTGLPDGGLSLLTDAERARAAVFRRPRGDGRCPTIERGVNHSRLHNSGWRYQTP